MASNTNDILKEKLVSVFKDEGTLSTTYQDIAREIISGSIQLCTFVEELRPYVTDKDVSIREKGIVILSSTLALLPKDFLSESEVHFIITFYYDRLKDHHSIIPSVLRGILAIVQMNHLPKDAPQCLFRNLFEHVPCQSQLTTDRRIIYSIFNILLHEKLDSLKTMGPDFVFGVISTIDGERDPRNLMLLFDILPYFMAEFSLGHLAEEMFDVIACYFPVDFNPSGSEELGITRNDLAEKLAPCLCAVPEFAEFCLPIIIEKLCSSLKVAKLDCLHLLCQGAKTFSTSGLKDHLFKLWSAIKPEVMPGGDVELRNAGLKAITALIEAISDDKPTCTAFIEEIIRDTKLLLCDVQLSLFKPAVKVLESVALVTSESCMQVLKIVVPLCLGQYSTRVALADKVILIETLNTFIKISNDHGFYVSAIPELSWANLPHMYLDKISEQPPELQVKLLLGLTIQRTYLSDTHRIMLYDFICNQINNGTGEIKKNCYVSLSAFAEPYPQEISALIMERLQLNNDKIETQVLIHRLEALSAVVKTYELGINILPEIVSKIQAENLKISHTALKCLYRLIATKNIEFNIHQFLYNECSIFDKFILLGVPATDERLTLMSNICRLVTRHLNIVEQQNIVNRYEMLLNGKINETDAYLIMNFFIPLHKNVALKITNNLLKNLYDLAINNFCLNIKQTACKFISVLLNKMDDGSKQFYEISSYFKDRIVNCLKANVDIEVQQAVIFLHIWLTKAMVTKGNNDAHTFLNNLTSALKNNEVGQYVAENYKILICEHDDALTEENFCTIKILYKQRVFEYLVQQNRNFENGSRENYLIALVYLFDKVPMELLLMHLIKLIPLLIESLSLDNEQLLYLTLITLKPVLDSKTSIASDKVQSFIPRFLKLSIHKSMRVRIAALECLTCYCSYPTVLIHKYKEDVVEQLAITIDDKKRLVRKVAMKARSQWCSKKRCVQVR